MLANVTVHKLADLGLSATADGLAEQLATWVELSFVDRLGLLVDQVETARESRRLATRLRAGIPTFPVAREPSRRSRLRFTLRTGQLLHPAPTPASRPGPGASLPGTLASPRT